MPKGEHDTGGFSECVSDCILKDFPGQLSFVINGKEFRVYKKDSPPSQYDRRQKKSFASSAIFEAFGSTPTLSLVCAALSRSCLH